MKIGPNMRDLITKRMAVEAVPAGGGIAEALNFLTTPGALGSGWKRANDWARAAVERVRLAGDYDTNGRLLGHPWQHLDDETIAGEILQRIKEKQKAT